MPRASAESIRAARDALDIADDHFPSSVAIIMDGNGRWAKSRNLPRPAGHQAGAKVVSKIVSEAARLGLDVLTLYSFSIENWKRPEREVQCLMHLYAEYLINERATLMENNVRLRHLGRRDGLPEYVLEELDRSLEISAANTGMTLCLALNYGSRLEIVDAVKDIAAKVSRGELEVDQIDESTVSESMYTAGLRDPDLVIRTAGQMRLSNYLLWQISYAELYVTDVYWPDFNEDNLHQALIDYANRSRRFGGLDQATKS